jgi:Ca2+-binding EF-hand superfamily protein
LYYVLSSNTEGTATHIPKHECGLLHRMLDLLWIKIQEKFQRISEAYRYFDVNFNNRVSFNEFQKGLDHLRIKYQVNEVDMIF